MRDPVGDGIFDFGMGTEFYGELFDLDQGKLALEPEHVLPAASHRTVQAYSFAGALTEFGFQARIDSSAQRLAVGRVLETNDQPVGGRSVCRRFHLGMRGFRQKCSQQSAEYRADDGIPALGADQAAAFERTTACRTFTT